MSVTPLPAPPVSMCDRLHWTFGNYRFSAPERPMVETQLSWTVSFRVLDSYKPGEYIDSVHFKCECSNWFLRFYPSGFWALPSNNKDKNNNKISIALFLCKAVEDKFGHGIGVKINVKFELFISQTTWGIFHHS